MAYLSIANGFFSIGLEAGEEYTISSDGFFELETQPKKAAVIGAGYIAVELAGVLHGLGTDTSLLVRHGHALRTFDEMLYTHLDKSMKESGKNEGE